MIPKSTAQEIARCAQRAVIYYGTVDETFDQISRLQELALQLCITTRTAEIDPPTHSNNTLYTWLTAHTIYQAECADLVRAITTATTALIQQLSGQDINPIAWAALQTIALTLHKHTKDANQ